MLIFLSDFDFPIPGQPISFWWPLRLWSYNFKRNLSNSMTHLGMQGMEIVSLSPLCHLQDINQYYPVGDEENRSTQGKLTINLNAPNFLKRPDPNVNPGSGERKGVGLQYLRPLGHWGSPAEDI